MILTSGRAMLSSNLQKAFHEKKDCNITIVPSNVAVGVILQKAFHEKKDCNSFERFSY